MRIIGQIRIGTVVGKDGIVIGGFEEVQIEPDNNGGGIAGVTDAAELLRQTSQVFKTCEVCQSKHEVWKQKHCQSCRYRRTYLPIINKKSKRYCLNQYLKNLLMKIFLHNGIFSKKYYLW